MIIWSGLYTLIDAVLSEVNKKRIASLKKDYSVKKTVHANNETASL